MKVLILAILFTLTLVGCQTISFKRDITRVKYAPDGKIIEKETVVEEYNKDGVPDWSDNKKFELDIIKGVGV